MDEYVLGFLFDTTKKSVLLIRKAVPEWQKGLLNGPGGKIEPNETADEAVRREVCEETGIDTQRWEFFGTIEGGDWRVSCYRAFVRFGDYSIKAVNITTEGHREQVEIWDIDDLNRPLAGRTIPNLKWLIPLALDSDRILSTGVYMET